MILMESINRSNYISRSWLRFMSTCPKAEMLIRSICRSYVWHILNQTQLAEKMNLTAREQQDDISLGSVVFFSTPLTSLNPEMVRQRSFD